MVSHDYHLESQVVALWLDYCIGRVSSAIIGFAQYFNPNNPVGLIGFSTFRIMTVVSKNVLLLLLQLHHFFFKYKAKQ